MRSVVQFWINTALSFANGVENLYVSIPQGKTRPVQNPILTILGITIVRLVWIISFFVEGAVNIGQGAGGLGSKPISVTVVEKKIKR